MSTINGRKVRRWLAAVAAVAAGATGVSVVANDAPAPMPMPAPAPVPPAKPPAGRDCPPVTDATEFHFPVLKSVGQLEPAPHDTELDTFRENMRKFLEGRKLTDPKTPAEALATAEQIVGRAKKAAAGNRFVLHLMAAEMALKNGQREWALGTLRELFGQYTLPETDVIDGLAGLIEKAYADAGEADLEPAATLVGRLMTTAIDQGNPAAAQALIPLAGKLAAKASPALKGRLTGLADRVGEIRPEYEAYQKALAELEKNPASRPHLFVVGRYLCLFEKRWEEGLPKLAKCNRVGWRQLAQQQLSNLKQDDADAHRRLGEGWLDLSEEEGGKLARRHLVEHARQFVQRADELDETTVWEFQGQTAKSNLPATLTLTVSRRTGKATGSVRYGDCQTDLIPGQYEKEGKRLALQTSRGGKLVTLMGDVTGELGAKVPPTGEFAFRENGALVAKFEKAEGKVILTTAAGK